MNKLLLNTEIQYFINTHANSVISDLLLKGTSFPGVETKIIIEQIEAKNKSKTKLPSWFSAENIYYPNKLNIEQTSSEITAKYKSELLDGDTIIDITGGFGVDCFYFSKQFKTVTHCEINETLSDIVAHNFKQLKVNTIKTVKQDGIDYLKTKENKYDWIYIDPSRRHEDKGKVFFLKDCLPDVPYHLESLFKYSKHIMIKTSPLLDLSLGINELNHVKTIHIVAVNNEVKELLWVLEAGFNKAISIKTVNIKKETNDTFQFYLEQEKQIEAQYSLPLTYLYEPNVAILKSGAFNEIAKQLDVYKLAKHSHLYTSETLVDFPGRVFEIKKTLVYNKKDVKKLALKKANITTRNFPETVKQIRQRFQIKDGGADYLFFTTDVNDKKTVLLTNKV